MDLKVDLLYSFHVSSFNIQNKTFELYTTLSVSITYLVWCLQWRCHDWKTTSQGPCNAQIIIIIIPVLGDQTLSGDSTWWHPIADKHSKQLKQKKYKRGNLLYSWGFNRHQGFHWRLLPLASHQGFRIQPIETSWKRQTRQQRARLFRRRLVKSRLVCWLALTKIWICVYTVSILWVCCLFVRTDIWQRSLDLPPAKPQLLVSLVITAILTLIIQIA